VAIIKNIKAQNHNPSTHQLSLPGWHRSLKIDVEDMEHPPSEGYKEKTIHKHIFSSRIALR